jgi:hypothetical protein
MPKPQQSLKSFVLLTAVFAVACAAFDVRVSLGQPVFGPRPQILAMFAVCCLVTELRPLRWLRRDEGGQVTASWTFMMATLLVAPPIAAVVISATVFLIGDLVSRKPVIKLAFNLAQIVVALSLGAAVLVLAGQDQALLPHGSPPVLWFPAPSPAPPSPATRACRPSRSSGPWGS